MQNKEELERRSQQDPILEDSSDETEVDFLELLYHLADKLPQILIAGFGCAALVFCLIFFVVTPRYQATTKLYVFNNSSDGGLTALVSDFQIGNYLTNDYRQLFTNKEVHDEVLRRLDLTDQYWLVKENRPNYQKLESMLNITNPSDTRVLTLAVTSEDENEARDLAKTYAEVAKEFIENRMETKVPTEFEKVYSSQLSKNTVRNTLIAFVLAALAMAAFYTIQFLMDDRITTSDFIEKRVGIVTLGMMPVVDQEEGSDDEGRRRNARNKGMKR